MLFCKSLNLFRDVVNNVKPGRLLGLKVGTTYVDVAVSDTKYALVSPYCVIEIKDNNMMAAEFKSLIAKLSVSGLIVAHPHNRRNQIPIAMDVNKFMYDLKNTKLLKGVKYAYWEEGFASEHAACVMHPFKFDAETEPQIIHKLVATGMLQIVKDSEYTLPRQQLSALRNSTVCTLSIYHQVNDAFNVYGDIKKSQQAVMQKKGHENRTSLS